MTDHLTIERQLDAPQDEVWAMWADPEHFAAWYGPTGATIPVAEFDLRVGGRRLVCMEVTTPDGPRRMWFAGEFRTVEPHERLVYTEFTSDEHGATLGEVTEVDVRLQPDGSRTLMTLTHVGIASDSPGAMGWTTALDKLAATLQARTVEQSSHPQK